MSKLNLLPRGYFEITTEANGVIKGRFCTWSMQRFCDRIQVVTLNELMKALTDNLSIPVMAQFLLSGVEYSHKGKDFPFKQDDAYEWIDELGGISGTELTRLITVGMRINDSNEAINEEKKTVPNP